MRTTLTLDEDVAAGLRRLVQERGVSFKAAVNATLRRGLSSDEPQARAFTVEPAPLGLRPGLDLTKAHSYAAVLEDDETIRKLELRK